MVIDKLLFGGAFDPIHHGHLHIARQALPFTKSLIFIPSGLNALDKKIQASGDDRLRMCQLAIEGEPAFQVSDIELQRAGKSYTIDTLQAFADGTTKLGLLLGADALLELHLWKSPEAILHKAALIVYNRPGVPVEQLQEVLKTPLFKGADVMLITDQALNISSTQVKVYSFINEPVTDFTPEPVARYIAERCLYRLSESNESM